MSALSVFAWLLATSSRGLQHILGRERVESSQGCIMLHQTGVHGMSPAQKAGLGLGCRASVAGLSRVEWAPARWDLPAQAQQSCRVCLVSQPQNWHRSCAVGA